VRSWSVQWVKVTMPTGTNAAAAGIRWLAAGAERGGIGRAFVRYAPRFERASDRRATRISVRTELAM